MIDIHSHILPGIDDGADSLETTLSMCLMASEDGIETMVATPHQGDGVYQQNASDVKRLVDDLNATLSEKNLSLTVIQGAEFHASPDLLESIQENQILTIGGHGIYVLLELPHQSIPPHIEQLLFDLQVAGIKPILVHPERNAEIQRTPDWLASVVERGVLVQVTAMSVTGDFGKKAEACVHEFLEKGLVHIVASDAHSIDKRPPILSRARNRIVELYGKQRGVLLFDQIPRKIIAGEPVDDLIFQESE